MTITLRVWRQSGGQTGGSEDGAFENFRVADVSPDMSFLEMLDVLNEQLAEAGHEPIAFDHDCREGICGSCGFMVDGRAHGNDEETTVCQLHMRRFADGDTLVLEPFRARAFPVLRDLVVDRSALDRVVSSGCFVSVSTGSAPDANAIPVPQETAELAMDAAACIGCGACVAACPNAAAMLFVSAKVSHLNLLPQGEAEKSSRVQAMVETMDAEGFGNCTNHYECMAACPKGIDVENIARMNRQFLASQGAR